MSGGEEGKDGLAETLSMETPGSVVILDTRDYLGGQGALVTIQSHALVVRIYALNINKS